MQFCNESPLFETEDMDTVMWVQTARARMYFNFQQNGTLNKIGSNMWWSTSQRNFTDKLLMGDVGCSLNHGLPVDMSAVPPLSINATKPANKR